MVIFLIGYRAAGKTTIGRLLADRLQCRWLDSDAEIEKSRGQTIPTIFSDQGEDSFRKIEQDVIRQILKNASASLENASAGESLVLSLGGGALLAEATQNLIKETGTCVWLRAPAEILAKRIDATADSTPRPALTQLDLADEVSDMLRQREPVYSDCADYDIDTSRLTAEQVVDQIAKWLAKADRG